MIAVDTNIVVRLLTQDDEQQYNASLKLFQEQDIFIPDTVILETEWVLRFAYRFQPAEICQALQNLLGLPNVQVTDARLLAQVLQWHGQGLDFADALHLPERTVGARARLSRLRRPGRGLSRFQLPDRLARP